MFHPQTIEEKSLLELSVTVTGEPEPQVQWFCDDKELHQTLKVNLKSEQGGRHSLLISGTKCNMSGRYRVVASNTAGQAEHAAPVNITSKYSLRFHHRLFTIPVRYLRFVQYLPLQPG